MRRRSARDKARAARLQPTLGQRHQLCRFRQGIGTVKPGHAVGRAGTLPARHRDRATEGAGIGGMGQGRDDEFADGHAGPGGRERKQKDPKITGGSTPVHSHEEMKLTVAVQRNRPARAEQTSLGEHRGGANG